VVVVCAYDKVIGNHFLHPNTITEEDGFEE
jgi:hypothetical protein